MKQYPGYVRYKKYHRVGSTYRVALENRSFDLVHGLSGIQASEAGKLTYKQLEACRRTLRRGFTKASKIWIRPFTSAPVTKKPVASRMGKGKGGISHWIAPVRKGKILFESSEYNEMKVKIVYKRVASRLPIKSRIIFPKY